MMHKNVIIDESGKFDGERLLVKLLAERRTPVQDSGWLCKPSYFEKHEVGEEIVYLMRDDKGVYEITEYQLPYGFLNGSMFEKRVSESGLEYDLPDPDPDGDEVSEASAECIHGTDEDDHCHECFECSVDYDSYGDPVWECGY